MNSIFRYPGGKTKRQAREWIFSHRPEGIREYREPFVGGGGIFFHIKGIDRWINDINPGLIAVYQALRDRPQEFLAACRAIQPPEEGEELTPPGPRGNARYNKRLSEEFARLCLNETCDQALRYFFVNRTVFGGRVNYDIPSRLYFSNPDGWNIVKGDTLERAAQHLAGTTITCGDYAPLLDEPGEKVWIYADPPYLVNTDLSPTSQLYQHGFTLEDHKRFADIVRASPHRVCISYDDDPEGVIRELFRGMTIDEGNWRYCGTTNEKKVAGRELLITNYKPHRLCIARPEICDLGQSLEEDEARRLAEYEATIEAATSRSYVEAGLALKAIRDSGKPSQRLYRQTHATFLEYCRDRWQLSEARATQLILAASAVERLKTLTNVKVLPRNEAQVRQLARLDETRWQDGWAAVVARAEREKTPITARLVKEEVERIDPNLTPDPPDYYGALVRLWKKLTPEDQQRFLQSLGQAKEEAA